MVTNDAKEDWVRREAGLIVGARPELVLEMKRRAGTDLLITQLGLFLKSAKAELGASVSPSTVAQAESLRTKAPHTARRLKVTKYLYPQLIEELTERIDACTAELARVEKFLSPKETTPRDRHDLRVLLGKEFIRRELLSNSLTCMRDNIVGETKIDYLIEFPDSASLEEARSALLIVRRRDRHHGPFRHSGSDNADLSGMKVRSSAVQAEIETLFRTQILSQQERERLQSSLVEAYQRAKEGDPSAHEEYLAAQEALQSVEMTASVIDERLRELTRQVEGNEAD